MPTVQETTIAQNDAIILLLADILHTKGGHPSEATEKAVLVASIASESWIEQLKESVDT